MEAVHVVVILVALVAMVYGLLQAGRRRKELEAWARLKGLSFSEAKDYGAEHRFPGFPCLAQGDQRYAYNCWSGDWRGRSVEGFDYHYQTYSHGKHGRRTHHHHFSVVIVPSLFPLKPLFIRPEGVFDKVTEFFGYDDIDLESAEFSRRFYVKSPDRRWAFDVLHARTMEFLLSRPRFHLQCGPMHLMAWQGGGRLSPEEFEQGLDVALGLLDGIPEYVVLQQKGAS